MKAEDVTDTLDLALQASGCDQARVVHRPRLLSDNGSSYISGDLAEWLDGQGMDHVRGAPYHPQTQGKIERWHQTLKNRILLENYYLPGDLEARSAASSSTTITGATTRASHNLTPADVYFGRGQTILLERERIKRRPSKPDACSTAASRLTSNQMSQSLPSLTKPPTVSKYLTTDKASVGDFVAHYNHLRYHESIANLTPADVYFGRGQTILLERERIKRQTIKTRRLHHRSNAA